MAAEAGQPGNTDTPQRCIRFVLIETDDGRKISVECRHRSGAQSVMWIEELAGRKQSLGLDGMIAVSVAGFSALARKKAKRFGIILYDFALLTDQEIASWAGGAKVEASFVQFEKLSILAGIPQAAEPSLPASPVLRFQDKDGYAIIWTGSATRLWRIPDRKERVGLIGQSSPSTVFL
jgi:Restriction endonuclease